jgi:glutaconate CoA-transferase subunit A
MSEKRKEVIIDAKEAVAMVRDGVTIGFGGFITSSVPMLIIREIIKRRVKDLYVVAPSSAGLDIDLLIASGCVKKLMTAYMGGEHYCPIAPFFRMAVQKGELELFECDEAQFYCALRAAAQGLPFLPWRSGVGTSFPEVNPEMKLFKDPIKGETLLAIPAVKMDIAFLHAAHADPYGNVQHVGTGFGDRAFHRSAARSVVQVEKIVPNEEIRRNPIATSIHGADAVVRAPYGAHPYASPGYYVEDDAHIKEYVQAANAYVRGGDRGPIDAYLEKYVYGPETHGEYLDRIGAKRLISLYEH